MRANQLILYKYFRNLEKEGKTNPIKVNAKLHADDILKSWKDFEVSEVKPEVLEVKKYSEKELFDMVKAEQVVILKELGISPIPSTEAERVKSIMEAQ